MLVFQFTLTMKMRLYKQNEATLILHLHFKKDKCSLSRFCPVNLGEEMMSRAKSIHHVGSGLQ